MHHALPCTGAVHEPLRHGPILCSKAPCFPPPAFGDIALPANRDHNKWEIRHVRFCE
jgi:hypothetical protein